MAVHSWCVALGAGIIPLTGTSEADHKRVDLRSSTSTLNREKSSKSRAFLPKNRLGECRNWAADFKRYDDKTTHYIRPDKRRDPRLSPCSRSISVKEDRRTRSPCQS